LFSVVEGRAIPIPSIFSQKVLGREGYWQPDKGLEPQKKLNFTGTERALNPNGYRATIRFRYDENFAKKHASNSLNTIRRIYSNVKNIWTWPSLTSSVIFDPDPNDIKVDAVKGSFVAEFDLDKAAAFSTTDANINVMLAFRNDKHGVLGNAYYGSVCGEAKNRTVLCEYYLSDSITAEVVAQQIGHNFNMKNDYNDQLGNTRLDSKGKSCTCKSFSNLFYQIM